MRNSIFFHHPRNGSSKEYNEMDVGDSKVGIGKETGGEGGSCIHVTKTASRMGAWWHQREGR